MTARRASGVLLTNVRSRVERPHPWRDVRPHRTRAEFAIWHRPDAEPLLWRVLHGRRFCFLFFVLQGFEQVYWGGNVRGYYFLSSPFHFFGARLPANRLLAFACAMILGGVLILVMRKTRFGRALRAIAIDPIAAGLT